MDDTDAFFTHTIVGPPLSVLLGRRQNRSGQHAAGLQVDPGSGQTRLSRLWQDWVVLSHACDPVGQPRLRPGRLRRALERHALWVAVTGLLSLTVSAAFWSVWLWS